MTPADFGLDLDDLDGPGYAAPLQVVDDRAFEGLQARQVIEAAATLSPLPVLAVAVLADARSMAESRSLESAVSVECVDLSGEYSETFRSLATSLAAAHANISEANLFFDELTEGNEVFDG